MRIKIMPTPSIHERIILERVDRYRVMEAMFEGIRVVMAYRGEPWSPAYIQGISGAAFRMAGICPCAPTCSAAMEPQALVRLLGYEVESLPLTGEGDVREERLKNVLERVKDEIRAARPVLLWHAFTSAEWDVVCGFDESTQEFYGRGSYMGHEDYAHAAETRTITCLDICPALGAILIGARTGVFDPLSAELTALREAVRHAFTVKPSSETDGWIMYEGLQCYDRWVNEWQNDPGRARGMGDSYCLGVYRSTHRAAGDFLSDIAPLYPSAMQAMLRASQAFTTEADALDEAVAFMGWEAPTAPDIQRNAQTAALLTRARDSYKLGIAEIANALREIED
jgi:hypothetical protein